MRVTKRERLRLSPAELIRLLECTGHPRDRAVLALAMNTALRASEIAGLRLGDVDLDGGWLTVRITKSAVEDLMPVTLELDHELRVWLDFYAANTSGPLGPTAYLFPAKAPGRWRYSTTPTPGVEQRMGNSVYVHGKLNPTMPIRKPAETVQRALRQSGYEIAAGEGLHTVRRSLARAFFDRESAAGTTWRCAPPLPCCTTAVPP